MGSYFNFHARVLWVGGCSGKTFDPKEHIWQHDPDLSAQFFFSLARSSRVYDQTSLYHARLVVVHKCNK